MRHTFGTGQNARLALFDFIEPFYNTHRRHSALGYLSPAEFERRWWQHQETVQGDMLELRIALNSHRIHADALGRAPFWSARMRRQCSTLGRTGA
jgi:hypothetical protein